MTFDRVGGTGMTRPAHTALPWRVFTSRDGRYLGVGEETGDGIIANGYGLWRDGDEALANAALIVRAVNCHDELVKALTLVLAWISGHDPNFIHDPDWPDDYATILAAVAKAQSAGSEP